MISHKHRFIFIHIPKTGGTSIASQIFQMCEVVVKHQFAEDIFEEREPGREYFSFSIVRNPWEREVSRYCYQRQNRSDDLHREANELTFKDWLKKRQEDRFFMNFLGAPQLDWLTDSNGGLLVEFVARLETIKTDWKHIREKLGVTTDIPRLNNSRHGHYSEYYDDETRAMVEEAYRKDIDFFQYGFEE